jgi:magnesium-transporting ATPase (P-type)
VRAAQLAAVYESVEEGLTIMGATAVEDKLQDEVAETIQYLLHVRPTCAC